MNIAKDISSLLSDNSELSNDFIKVLQPGQYAKNTILHDAGEVCKKVFIIRKGLARVFYYKKDKNISAWFAQENEAFTAIDSFIQGNKSKYSIEVLEDSEIVVIRKVDMESLYAKHPAFEHFGRLFFQNAYVELADRIEEMQFQTAQERYQKLLHTKPTIIQRVPLVHIASYLGITQETLSRIRSKVV